MTSAGRMSKADAARMRFAKHYEIMRKYHTQVNRIKKGNIAKNNKTGRTGFSGRLSGNGHLSYKTNAAVLIYGRKVVLW